MFFSRIFLSALFSTAALVAANPSFHDEHGVYLRDVGDTVMLPRGNLPVGYSGDAKSKTNGGEGIVMSRALPVTFSNDVHSKTNSADRKRLTSAVRAHHNALPDSHPAKQATGAHLWKGPHTSPDDSRLHSTVDFHTDTQHITTHHVLHRRALPVTFSNDVHAQTSGKDRKWLTSAVRAHHNALPDNHSAKQASSAHVWKGPHTSPEDSRLHSTVDFYAGNQHITTHHVLHRRALPVTFSNDVHSQTSGKDRKWLTSAVRAHHNALPAEHPAKQATGAHLWKGPHTSPDDSRLHSTVDFHTDTHHITTHHVLHRDLNSDETLKV